MNNLNTDENIAGKQIQKRKKLLLIFAAVIVIVAGSSTAWWYFDLRDVQSTDDAYVKGNQIAIHTFPTIFQGLYMMNLNWSCYNAIN